RDGVADISIDAPGAPSVAGKECGNGMVIDHGGGWETKYCHMARGSLKVKAGDTVSARQAIGRVGLSGETAFPHVHFKVLHGGRVVDPFAPAPVSAGACPAQTTLWTPQAARALSYRRGEVLNTGFGTRVSTMEDVESGAVAAPGGDPPAIVAYARLIGLEAGDVVELRLKGPDGKVLAEVTQPIDHDTAVWLSQVGRKRSAAGWRPGAYVGEAVLRRGRSIALSREWRTALRPS
ncbi:MAG: M23 family metallopeptidase, partial [Proteobacteria bacterium]|nr:M23 family metallopeptidase [Pseudomonadota bacterium]